VISVVKYSVSTSELIKNYIFNMTMGNFSPHSERERERDREKGHPDRKG